MKTASEILGKYEDDNEFHFHKSDREFIIKAMEEYTDQWRKHPLFQKSTLQPVTVCGGCTRFIPDGPEFLNIGKCPASTTYTYSKKVTDICDCGSYKAKKKKK